MSCKLCHKDNEVRESHIIPEFIYRPLYDAKHRFHVVSTEARSRRPYEQKGAREKLLCDSCEQLISKHEDYAAHVLNGGVPLWITREGRLFVVKNIDYQQFKLFQLSIVWRASVATHHFFKKVSLGPHEERIRTMLLANSPGEPLEYPCVMLSLVGECGFVADIIEQPKKVRLFGQLRHRFMFGGFVWVYLTGEWKLPRKLREVVLDRSGRLILLADRFDKLQHLKNFAVELRRMGRMPIVTKNEP